VTLVGYEKDRRRLCYGIVAAMWPRKRATDAGAAAARRVGELVSVHVIPRPRMAASMKRCDHGPEPRMIIARIVGTVVASQKDPRLEGKKLLIVRPVNLDGTDTTGYVVAVDTVGAGFHERVLVVAGSSARLAQNMKDTPVDAAVVA